MTDTSPTTLVGKAEAVTPAETSAGDGVATAISPLTTMKDVHNNNDIHNNNNNHNNNNHDREEHGDDPAEHRLSNMGTANTSMTASPGHAAGGSHQGHIEEKKIDPSAATVTVPPTQAASPTTASSPQAAAAASPLPQPPARAMGKPPLAVKPEKPPLAVKPEKPPMEPVMPQDKEYSAAVTYSHGDDEDYSKGDRGQSDTVAETDATGGIDNGLRFTQLFLGMMVVIVAATVGSFAVYGFYVMRTFAFPAVQIVDIFTIGTAAGMGFAFIAGLFYDLVGPRPLMLFCILLLFVSCLVQGIIFHNPEKIMPTWQNISGLYFLMNAGSYGLQLAVTVTALTHVPKNRGMACGLMQTLIGLGASLMSCLWRGFFVERVDILFFFMTAFVVVLGVPCAWFFKPAEWAELKFIRRLRRGRLRFLNVAQSGEESAQVQRELLNYSVMLEHYIRLKVPYLKYRLPLRRVRLVFGVLLLLNVFMTVQMILIAYVPIKKRSILCVISALAVVFVSLLTVIVWPFAWLDGNVQKANDDDEQDLVQMDGQTMLNTKAEQGLLISTAKPLSSSDDLNKEDTSNETNNNNNNNNPLVTHNHTRSPSTTMLVSGSNTMTPRLHAALTQDIFLATTDPMSMEASMVELMPSAVAMDNDYENDNNFGNSIIHAGESMLLGTSTSQSWALRRHQQQQQQQQLQHHRSSNELRRSSIDLLGAVAQTLSNPPEELRVAVNYDSVSEVLKHRHGFFRALITPELLIMLLMSFVTLGTGLVITNNLFIMLIYNGVKKGAMNMDRTYYMYASLTGVAAGAGRVSLGMLADDLMPWLRRALNQPFGIPFTWLLFGASWLTVLALILFLAIHPAHLLLLPYIIISFAFGLTSACIPYAVSTFFSYEHVGIGRVYGLCLAAAGAGVAVLYRGTFWDFYGKNAFPMDFPLPAVRGLCFAGKKDCVKDFLVVCLVLNVFSALCVTVLHLRYWLRLRAAARLYGAASMVGGGSGSQRMEEEEGGEEVPYATSS